MQNALILPILITFLISGCASTKSLEIFTKEVERMPLDLDMPPVVALEQINWKIINEGNQEEVFAELKKANIDAVLFGLTDEDYELLQKNNVQMRNQIIKYRAIIEAYKQYYEPEEQQGKEDSSSIIKSSDFEPKKLTKDD